MLRKNVEQVCIVIATVLLGMLVIRYSPATRMNFEDAPAQPCISSLTSHPPILISSDGDFSPANGVVGGDGSSTAPYIITDWSINGGVTGPCISIRSTTAYFIIQGCSLMNGSHGIYLENVTNGIVDQNFCTNNTYGIYLKTLGSYPIYNRTCHDNQIQNNYCFNNSNTGIYITDTENITISWNNCSLNSIYGLAIYSSTNATVNDNVMANSTNGMEIHAIDSNVVGNLCVNNTYNGIFSSSQNCNFTSNNCSNNAVGFYLYGYTNCTVHENILTNNEKGLFIYELVNSTISNNNITYTGPLTGSITGISLQQNSNYLRITGNQIIYQDFGVTSYSCQDVTIEQNLLKWCRWGIDVSNYNLRVKIIENRVLYSNVYTIILQGSGMMGLPTDCEIGFNSMIGPGTFSLFSGINTWAHDNYWSGVSSAPIAAFGASAINITPGEQVQFTDMTTGGNPKFTYNWNFGDGPTNATTQNPTHVYATEGSYEVTYTVKDIDGDVSIAIPMEITVTTGSVNTGGGDQPDKTPNNVPGFPLEWFVVASIAGIVVIIKIFFRKKIPIQEIR